jgi:uncharacterized protein (DUF952 family)
MPDLPPEVAGRPLLHCCTQEQWQQARRDGESTVSTRGRTLAQEGFIHCCFAEQLAGVLQRFYAGVDELVLLEIDAARLDVPVRIEPPLGQDGTEGFPHVFGPVPVAAVTAVTTIRRGSDGWSPPV